jgi:hypothetical protein
MYWSVRRMSGSQRNRERCILQYMLRAISITLLTCAVLSVVGFGFLHVISIGHDNHGYICPFIASAPVICSTSFSDHLTAWRLALSFTVAIIGVAMVALYFMGNVFLPDFPANGYRFESLYRYISNPLQILFARGILNPRIP